jgi:FK506-binding protein 1
MVRKGEKGARKPEKKTKIFGQPQQATRVKRGERTPQFARGRSSSSQARYLFVFNIQYSTMGVEKETIEAGDGENFPKSGDRLTMHYTGTLADGGKQFDSSVTRGKPFQFIIGIGQVIQGWDEGVMKMSLGEKALLKISSDYGYGTRGAPGAIPPNADLNFEVELLAIGDKKAPGFTDSGSCIIL